jgi:hypothetical protein
MMKCPSNRFENKAYVKCPFNKNLMCKNIPWWTCRNYQLNALASLNRHPNQVNFIALNTRPQRD